MFPRIFLCNGRPHPIHRKCRLSKCNFLTRRGLHEHDVMNRKLIFTEIFHVYNDFEAKGTRLNGWDNFDLPLERTRSLLAIEELPREGYIVDDQHPTDLCCGHKIGHDSSRPAAHNKVRKGCKIAQDRINRVRKKCPSRVEFPLSRYAYTCNPGRHVQECPGARAIGHSCIWRPGSQVYTHGLHAGRLSRERQKSRKRRRQLRQLQTRS